MMQPAPRKASRCAIYTRKSTEHNLDLEFNSRYAQQEACESYIKSQAHEGCRLIRTRYDDGGLSGASLDRPALQELLDDVRARKIDIIVVYKVDRLTRSLADFAKLVELFDQHSVSFVSITQSFNTTTSMGRLTLNVLLSCARSSASGSGTRLRPRSARAFGSAAPSRSAMPAPARSWSSCPRRPRRSAPCSGSISNAARSAPWRRNSVGATSPRRPAPSRAAGLKEAGATALARSRISSRTASTSATWPTVAKFMPASMSRSSTAPRSTPSSPGWPNVPWKGMRTSRTRPPF